MNLLVHHIKELVPVRTDGSWLAGNRMRELGILHDASVVVRDGIIRWVGPSSDLPSGIASDVHQLDASAYVACRGSSTPTRIWSSPEAGTRSSPCARPA